MASTLAKRASTLKAMLAQPRMPEEPTPEMLAIMREAPLKSGDADDDCQPEWGKRIMRSSYRALYAHLRATGDDNQHGQTGVTQASVIASTPIENPELRAALSTLRGWSAEAAGRMGLKDSILLVCNAAESTLPITLYRIRARGLDAVHEGPVSISEVKP